MAPEGRHSAPGPRIAVAIPTYQRPDFLGQLTDTIPAYVNIYVSDNGSSMAGVARSFAPNVRISGAPSLLPIFANWNRALSLVDDDSSHVLIPSDDDLYLAGGFARIEQALADHPDADVLIFGCDFADETGHTWAGYRPASHQIHGPGQGFCHFKRDVPARMPGILFRRDFLARIGAFDERFTLTAADSELIQRALLLGSSVFVPETVGLYRVWNGSLTHARQASTHWMAEIDLWVDKIAALIADSPPVQARVSIARYKDEIYAANLRAGIRSLKKAGKYFPAWQHVLGNRYPRHASVATQAKLLAHLLLPATP